MWLARRRTTLQSIWFLPRITILNNSELSSLLLYYKTGLSNVSYGSITSCTHMYTNNWQGDNESSTRSSGVGGQYVIDFGWSEPFWPGLLKCSTVRYQAISRSIKIHQLYSTPSRGLWVHISASLLHLRWKSLHYGEFGLRFQFWMWYVTGP